MTTISKKFLPANDGIDHINIYSKGQTELGRLLSNFAETPFEHPLFGYFESVEGFWYWSKTGKMHDDLRYLSGYDAKAIGKKYKEVFNPAFEKEIKECITLKIEQNRTLFEMLKASTHPFTHYYVYEDKIEEPKGNKWEEQHIEFERKKTLWM